MRRRRDDGRTQLNIEDLKSVLRMDFHMDRTLKAVNGSLNVTIPRQFADELGWKKGDRISFSRTPRGLTMTATSATSTLRTIGYEGYDLDGFVGALRRAGIKQLLDIRDLPLSRRKGFSKSPLREALSDAGILYEHLRELGAPKPIREPFVTGEVSHATFKKAYLEHLASHRSALTSVKWH
jgi:hypothetical protein